MKEIIGTNIKDYRKTYVTTYGSFTYENVKYYDIDEYIVNYKDEEWFVLVDKDIIIDSYEHIEE